MAANEETWKSIPGYEGFYDFSSRGRVRSNRRVVTNRRGQTKTIHRRILRPAYIGHYRVPAYRLCVNGEVRTFYLSVLWRLVFNEEPRPWE